MSLREQLRAYLPRKKLDVPALGGEVEVVGLTAGDMSAVGKMPAGVERNAAFLARALHKDGKRLVADGEEADLLDLPHKLFKELLDEADSISFPESTEGNSAATTGGDSSSD
jgi:hypothetical protein